jgi:hypothetical protein
LTSKTTPDTRAAAAMNDNSQSRISVRAASGDFFGHGLLGYLHLRNGLLLDGLNQVVHLGVWAAAQILQDAVDQTQGQGDVLLVHINLHAVADKGQRRNPMNVIMPQEPKASQ